MACKGYKGYHVGRRIEVSAKQHLASLLKYLLKMLLHRYTSYEMSANSKVDCWFGVCLKRSGGFKLIHIYMPNRHCGKHLFALWQT